MAKTSKGFFDLRSQFVFYASYHNNTANVVIHLFCIWQLVATLLVLLQVFGESIYISGLSLYLAFSFRLNKKQGQTVYKQRKIQIEFVNILYFMVE